MKKLLITFATMGLVLYGESKAITLTKNLSEIYLYSILLVDEKNKYSNFSTVLYFY